MEPAYASETGSEMANKGKEGEEGKSAQRGGRKGTAGKGGAGGSPGGGRGEPHCMERARPGAALREPSPRGQRAPGNWKLRRGGHIPGRLCAPPPPPPPRSLRPGTAGPEWGRGLLPVTGWDGRDGARGARPLRGNPRGQQGAMWGGRKANGVGRGRAARARRAAGKEKKGGKKIN